MFSTFFTVALFVAPAIQGVFADFSVNTPILTQCKSSKISWEATKGPYNLIVVKSSDPCGDALVEVGDFNTTFINWTTTVPSGTKVLLSLLDADDNEAWSNEITVASSTDSSCLSTASSASASGSGSAASASATAASGTTPGSTGTSSTTDSSSADGSSSSDVSPVGAANAGSYTDAAITVRQASKSLLLLTGFSAVLALSL